MKVFHALPINLHFSLSSYAGKVSFQGPQAKTIYELMGPETITKQLSGNTSSPWFIMKEIKGVNCTQRGTTLNPPRPMETNCAITSKSVDVKVNNGAGSMNTGDVNIEFAGKPAMAIFNLMSEETITRDLYGNSSTPWIKDKTLNGIVCTKWGNTLNPPIPSGTICRLTVNFQY